MGRAFQIFGEIMVLVRFNINVPYSPQDPFNPNLPPPVYPNANIWALGLTQNAIKITYNFRYTDINIDAYGPHIPADVLSQIADATIEFNLVHYDPEPLAYYQRECLAGGSAGFDDSNTQGTMNYAGVPLGGGVPLYQANCHYVGLEFYNQSIGSPPVTFPATYLTEPPVRYQIGTKRTIFECKARALPYTGLQNLGGTAPGDYTVPIYGVELVTSTDLSNL